MSRVVSEPRFNPRALSRGREERAVARPLRSRELHGFRGQRVRVFDAIDACRDWNFLVFVPQALRPVPLFSRSGREKAHQILFLSLVILNVHRSLTYSTTNMARRTARTFPVDMCPHVSPPFPTFPSREGGWKTWRRAVESGGAELRVRQCEEAKLPVVGERVWVGW